MRLIGINGTGEEALTDCVTDGAGNAGDCRQWRSMIIGCHQHLRLHGGIQSADTLAVGISSFLGLPFLCCKDLDYGNKEQHFAFMFHFG